MNLTFSYTSSSLSPSLSCLHTFLFTSLSPTVSILLLLLQEADIVIPCTGSPGLLQPQWIKPGAVVVNVGTTFLHDTMHGDIASEQSFLPQGDY